MNIIPLPGYDDIDAATRHVVDQAISQAKEGKVHVSLTLVPGRSDVYAYPYADGLVSWGVNGPPNGFLIARGIR